MLLFLSATMAQETEKEFVEVIVKEDKPSGFAIFLSYVLPVAGLALIGCLVWIIIEIEWSFHLNRN